MLSLKQTSCFYSCCKICLRKATEVTTRTLDDDHGNVGPSLRRAMTKGMILALVHGAMEPKCKIAWYATTAAGNQQWLHGHWTGTRHGPRLCTARQWRRFDGFPRPCELGEATARW